jgi:hypothetical protein
MSAGAGITLITVGAVLRFALSPGSPHGLNVHVVGVILVLAGVLGLLLPRLVRAPRDRLRRWIFPIEPPHDPAEPPPIEEPSIPVYRPIPDDDLVRHEADPTLADDILRAEHDPPLIEDLRG